MFVRSHTLRVSSSVLQFSLPLIGATLLTHRSRFSLAIAEIVKFGRGTQCSAMNRCSIRSRARCRIMRFTRPVFPRFPASTTSAFSVKADIRIYNSRRKREIYKCARVAAQLKLLAGDVCNP